MDIIFKQIHIEDKNKVLLLFKEAAEKIAKKNVDHWQYWKNPPQEKIQWVEEGIQNDEFFFVEDSHKQNIGMLRILEEDMMYWGKQNEKAKYIHSLVVIERLEGRGIGKAILQKVEIEAKKEGYKFLRLDSDAKNPRLCNYYEQQGFRKVGTKTLPISTYNLYQKELV
ncbi:GNAT family N-acetyltransferase [Mesonia ostreae]|uniref:GNAT family N-acetyltransferase n=1 Tax=Mesonia ostreae TaxID=861110 RepID=A0ABU2KGC8_9FLAO|nr:GNAT family N-acetyltransferase [Mesonia ostreae]MDT0293724.1 GNAT family N-acetyltransferase [Mesonia ostreae]